MKNIKIRVKSCFVISLLLSGLITYANTSAYDSHKSTLDSTGQEITHSSYGTQKRSHNSQKVVAKSNYQRLKQEISIFMTNNRKVMQMLKIGTAVSVAGITLIRLLSNKEVPLPEIPLGPAPEILDPEIPVIPEPVIRVPLVLSPEIVEIPVAAEAVSPLIPDRSSMPSIPEEPVILFQGVVPVAPVRLNYHEEEHKELTEQQRIASTQLFGIINENNDDADEVNTFFLNRAHSVCVNVENENGDTPLRVAVMTNQPHIVKALLNHNANPINPMYTNRKHCILWDAIMLRNPEKDTTFQQNKFNIIQLLLDAGADVNAQDICGRTSLYYGIERCDHGNVHIPTREKCCNRGDHDDGGKIVRMLLKAGAHINARDCDGQSGPLHYAVDDNDIDMVQLLLKSKAFVDIRDKRGNTPLHRAARYHYYNASGGNAVCILLKSGAHVNAQDNERNTPLHYLVRECCLNNSQEDNHLKMIAILNQKPYLDFRNDRGYTILQQAFRDACCSGQPRHNSFSDRYYAVLMRLILAGSDVTDLEGIQDRYAEELLRDIPFMKKTKDNLDMVRRLYDKKLETLGTGYMTEPIQGIMCAYLVPCENKQGEYCEKTARFVCEEVARWQDSRGNHVKVAFKGQRDWPQVVELRQEREEEEEKESDNDARAMAFSLAGILSSAGAGVAALNAID